MADILAIRCIGNEVIFSAVQIRAAGTCISSAIDGLNHAYIFCYIIMKFTEDNIMTCCGHMEQLVHTVCKKTWLM